MTDTDNNFRELTEEEISEITGGGPAFNVEYGHNLVLFSNGFQYMLKNTETNKMIVVDSADKIAWAIDQIS